MSTLTILLSKNANGTTCQAGLSNGDSDIDFPRSTSAQAACQAAAAELRALADKFEALAQTATPFNGDTQDDINNAGASA